MRVLLCFREHSFRKWYTRHSYTQPHAQTRATFTVFLLVLALVVAPRMSFLRQRLISFGSFLRCLLRRRHVNRILHSSGGSSTVRIVGQFFGTLKIAKAIIFIVLNAQCHSGCRNRNHLHLHAMPFVCVCTRKFLIILLLIRQNDGLTHACVCRITLHKTCIWWFYFCHNLTFGR